ncbi:hypothetical protein PQI66_06195 [Corynebacterium sp. USCH3]|uniref:hypothetical protein n=1 Tax=Corynebacterium sp. USCH3 TaxID=3024840 RepID=UPI0030A47997
MKIGRPATALCAAMIAAATTLSTPLAAAADDRISLVGTLSTEPMNVTGFTYDAGEVVEWTLVFPVSHMNFGVHNFSYTLDWSDNIRMCPLPPGGASIPHVATLLDEAGGSGTSVSHGGLFSDGAKPSTGEFVFATDGFSTEQLFSIRLVFCTDDSSVDPRPDQYQLKFTYEVTHPLRGDEVAKGHEEGSLAVPGGDDGNGDGDTDPVGSPGILGSLTSGSL